MKQLLIELDDETAAKLEQVAPGRSRQRSHFIRSAIRRALWALEEQATAEAYRAQPDSVADAYVDVSVWEQDQASKKRKTGRRR
jgi:predicted transcriptional regulator